jgi:hypothetical protein
MRARICLSNADHSGRSGRGSALAKFAESASRFQICGQSGGGPPRLYSVQHLGRSSPLGNSIARQPRLPALEFCSGCCSPGMRSYRASTTPARGSKTQTFSPSNLSAVWIGCHADICSRSSQKTSPSERAS